MFQQVADHWCPLGLSRVILTCRDSQCQGLSLLTCFEKDICTLEAKWNGELGGTNDAYEGRSKVHSLGPIHRNSQDTLAKKMERRPQCIRISNFWKKPAFSLLVSSKLLMGVSTMAIKGGTFCKIQQPLLRPGHFSTNHQKINGRETNTNRTMQKNHDQTLNAFLEGRKRKLLGGSDATIPFLMQRLPVLLAKWFTSSRHSDYDASYFE